MEHISVVKIGGKVIEEAALLLTFLRDFAALEGPKLLVHGGGRNASRLAQRLGMEVRMVEGRRVVSIASSVRLTRSMAAVSAPTQASNRFWLPERNRSSAIHP